MNFLALATDYDGTLARDGRVEDTTISALERLHASGRKLVLVTGRVLDDLLAVFPRHDLFEWIVAENGALLYSPRTQESRLLTEQVPPGLIERLQLRGVTNIGAGQCIVGTWIEHACTVLETLRDMGLDRQIIFNKTAVMILPTGVNKAFGLAAALSEMKLSAHNVVAVGDAENDLPMLTLCECSVAVSNALDSVRHKADLVTKGDHGAGVEELISGLLKDDLNSKLASSGHRQILLGTAKLQGERKVFVPSVGRSLLVAGPSGSGKSTAATGLVERIAEAKYQFCLFDPEGDYDDFESAVRLGNPHYVPRPDEVMALVDRMHNVAVNLLGVSLDSRPDYVSEIIRKLEHLRSARGRPHWFVIDEAHHIFPSDSPPETTLLVQAPKTSLMITVHPEHLRKEALKSVDIVIAVGKDPAETIRGFCKAAHVDEPSMKPVELEVGEILIWFRHAKAEPFVVKVEPGKSEHKRHIRKYAHGDLGDRGFVFRGPNGGLNLAAQNLDTFIRMGEGVDDETWLYHLRIHDYSRWMRFTVKDQSLADELATAENDNLDANESRNRIFGAIRAKYTAPE
jgi:hydroxymethylpyrimidine pyrophosphatase-like HAD family hydrolase